jgi:hypothetical protein
MKKNIIVHIIITILLFIITFLIYNFRKNKENFDNCNCDNNNSGSNFDYGVETVIIDSTYNETVPRTIKFHKIFSKIPQVFTQIIGNSNDIDNIMTINVLDNITTQNFNYIIRGVSNKNIGTDGKMKVLGINNKHPVKFYWMAIG